MSLTDQQRKTLDWVLECQIEITADKAPGYEPHQALEEINGLTSLAELLGNPRHLAMCEGLRVEHQQRVDALPPEVEECPETETIRLLNAYGTAKFGDEWWPGNAVPHLGEERGRRLEALLGDA